MFNPVCQSCLLIPRFRPFIFNVAIGWLGLKSAISVFSFCFLIEISVFFCRLVPWTLFRIPFWFICNYFGYTLLSSFFGDYFGSTFHISTVSWYHHFSSSTHVESILTIVSLPFPVYNTIILKVSSILIWEPHQILPLFQHLTYTSKL